MNLCNENVSATPLSAEWKERQAHESVMAKIAKVKGYRQVDYGDPVYGGGPYVTWKEDKLSLDELNEIMARGRHDEIMALIERYNHAVSTDAQQQTGRPAYFSLPEEIQEQIALRGNREEIDAYLSCQGFGAKGQDVVLDRGNHEEILDYVSKHGLLEAQQRKLLKRGNDEEIRMHISRHGLAEAIIDEMLDDVERTGDCKFFYYFIDLHELPISGQKKMLCVVPEWAILDYFNKYGLWNEAHITLLLHCPKEVIISYFQKHHYLCPEAEDVLATLRVQEVRRELIDAYMHFWKNGCFLPKDYFLRALLKEPENNRDVIAQVLLKMPYTDTFLRDELASDIELIQKASDEEVMARIEKGGLLNIHALSELFFNRDDEFFYRYIAKCNNGVFYSL